MTSPRSLAVAIQTLEFRQRGAHILWLPEKSIPWKILA